MEGEREAQLSELEAKYKLKQMESEGKLRTQLAKKHHEEK